MKLLWALPFVLISSCVLRPNGHITIDNTDRTYTLHLPKGYAPENGPYPVVFVLHGNPSKGWQMQLYTGMSKTADENGFIAIYPDGIDKVWQFDDGERVAADVAFMEGLLQHLEHMYAVDTARIYFAGISGGALLLSSLSQAMSTKVAAICKVAAGRAQVDQLGDLPDSDPPIPVILIFGTEDFLYNGISERGILSAEETVAYWRKRNKCRAEPTIKELPDVAKKDHTHVTTFRYSSEIGSDVLFYRIEGGGHHWPNSRFNASTFYKAKDLGHLNKDFNTNQAIWEFFSATKSR